MVYGPTGRVMLGYFWWVYQGFSGPLHWINDTKVAFFPEDKDLVSDFSVSLKPGVSMTWKLFDDPIDGTAGILSGLSTFTPVFNKLPRVPY